jgi:hypothetical protein
MLAPKGHVVVVHVPQFVRWCEACGVFGEDGVEALHCRRIMRNPEARKKAQDLHHAARAATPDLVRDICAHVEGEKKKQRQWPRWT